MHRNARAAILFAAAMALLAGCGRRPEQKETPLPLPQGTPNRPVGMKALSVNPGAAEPFSKADVAAWLAAHNLPLNAGAKTDFTVANLEFLTAKQASDRLAGEPTGLPDNDRVGFATLTGTFVFSGPPHTKPATFASAYALFDAASGNLLMDGSLESGKGDNAR